MIAKTRLIKAIDHALSGKWRDAHEIVQQDEENGLACWIHAVLHKIEGDEGNSRYWYRRASQSYEAHGDARAELVTRLLGLLVVAAALEDARFAFGACRGACSTHGARLGAGRDRGLGQRGEALAERQ